MVYFILRFCIRWQLGFFIKHITVSGLTDIPENQPVLLASTHPNSFLDALIIACYSKRKVWSLSRGDVFQEKWATTLLSHLCMMPIYRIKEGRNKLGENEETFQKCVELFKKNEVVLIFPEGVSLYQNDVLPLRKGTARLAQKAWNEGIPLKIIPISIQYHSFNEYGKIVELHAGKPFDQQHIGDHGSEGLFNKTFNAYLTHNMKSLQKPLQNSVKSSWFFKIGRLVFFPFIFLLEKFTARIVQIPFYDSVLFALFFFSTPLYLALVWEFFKFFLA